MLILSSVIVLCCVFFNKISDKFGLPALLAFILLGMLFGSDGLFKIEFDNYKFAEEICSVGLVFIIFYGGFGTKWSEAKKGGRQVTYTRFRRSFAHSLCNWSILQACAGL